MPKERQFIPIGTIFDKLTVIENGIIITYGTAKYSAVRVKCVCGEEFVKGEKEIKHKHKFPQSCPKCLNKRIDFSNTRFGKLTAVKEIDRFDVNHSYYWLCKCDCGNETEVTSNRLRYGITKSCGCLQKEAALKISGSRRLNIAGERRGKLLAIKVSDVKNSRGTRDWVCKCDCGNEITLSTHRFLNKKLPSCGCDRHFQTVQSGIDSVYSFYKRNANKRQIRFNLNKEEFGKLLAQSCFYCGSLPSNISRKGTPGEYRYNGIDRIDNNKGYELDNCVTCCKICNVAKANLGLGEFIEWISKINNNLNKIRELNESI